MITADNNTTATSADTEPAETVETVAQIADQAAPLAELVDQDRPVIDYVDPADLELGQNIRTDVQLSREFVASLAEHGNLHSILVWRREDQVLEVIDGQRRTLGLIRAGVKRAKVEIHPTRQGAEDKARDIERIAMQWVSNEHRDQLKSGERFAAIEQMFNLGLSATKVARKLGISRDEAKAAAEVAKSEQARAAHTSGQLTLEQSAALAEFTDPDHVETLLRAATYGQFDQTAARIRERIAEQAAYAAASVEWIESGYTVLTQRPYWNEFHTYAPLHYLAKTADGGDVTAADITDPVHWAVYLEEVEEWRSVSTGEPVNGDTEVDWELADDPDAEPADGLLHPDRVRAVPAWEPTYYCLDVEGAGLHHRSESGPTRRTDTGADPAEIEAKAEAKRMQNRITKVCNKAARRATVDRRKFLVKFLRGRKSAPKGSVTWATRVLVANRDILHGADQLATQMLGTDPRKAVEDATEGRTGAVLFGMTAAAVEHRMLSHEDRPHYWRTPQNSPGYYIGHDISQFRPYLEFLRGLGHELADIDRYVLGEITVEELMEAEAERSAAEKAAGK